jgi:plasmid maintenance system antidote protein VapI
MDIWEEYSLIVSKILDKNVNTNVNLQTKYDQAMQAPERRQSERPVKEVFQN